MSIAAKYGGRMFQAIVAGDTRCRRTTFESFEARSDGAACNADAIALRHFVVDMDALGENLHDRTVRRARANGQLRDCGIRPRLGCCRDILNLTVIALRRSWRCSFEF